MLTGSSRNPLRPSFAKCHRLFSCLVLLVIAVGLVFAAKGQQLAVDQAMMRRGVSRLKQIGRDLGCRSMEGNQGLPQPGKAVAFEQLDELQFFAGMSRNFSS